MLCFPYLFPLRNKISRLFYCTLKIQVYLCQNSLVLELLFILRKLVKGTKFYLPPFLLTPLSQSPERVLLSGVLWASRVSPSLLQFGIKEKPYSLIKKWRNVSLCSRTQTLSESLRVGLLYRVFVTGEGDRVLAERVLFSTGPCMSRF